MHYWEVWHGGKPFEVYRDIHGFASEFGFQSFPEPKTVRSFTEPSDRDSVYSDMMKYHECSNRMYLDVKEDGTIGTDKIMKTMKRYFRDPKDFESTLWLSQILQGYAIKYAAEGWRRDWPRSTGCMYWQYDDCWPGSSWSSVDYFGRWKALHNMAKKFYSPILVSGVPDAKTGKVNLYVISDRMQRCTGKLKWMATDLLGEALTAGSLDVDIPAHKSEMVRTLSLQEQLHRNGADNVLLWLELEVDGATVSDNTVAFVYPRELNLADPALSAEVDEKNGTFVVAITAQHPALWAWVSLNGIDARCSQNFIDLAKDARAEIEMRPAKPMGKSAFEKALRVRSLFDTYSR